MHTQNILADGRASLLVTEPEATEDPLGAGRVTLMGRVARTPDEALPSVRERYLERYENASYWVDFKDFAFFQMELIDLYFVGGFGVMGWVTAELRGKERGRLKAIWRQASLIAVLSSEFLTNKTMQLGI